MSGASDSWGYLKKMSSLYVVSDFATSVDNSSNNTCHAISYDTERINVYRIGLHIGQFSHVGNIDNNYYHNPIIHGYALF